MIEFCFYFKLIIEFNNLKLILYFLKKKCFEHQSWFGIVGTWKENSSSLSFVRQVFDQNLRRGLFLVWKQIKKYQFWEQFYSIQQFLSSWHVFITIFSMFRAYDWELSQIGSMNSEQENSLINHYYSNPQVFCH